jgi:outer membrane receptor protein involved in Fe transport
MTTPPSLRHRRPEDAVLNFVHASPKVGVTFQVTDRSSVFLSYRHAFRAPSEGQLFRQGSAANTIDLEPVRADNLEVGLRTRTRAGFSFDLSAYQLDKRDDILSYRDPLDGATQAVNAGHTRHKGVEAAVGTDPAAPAGLRVAYTYARHSYETWIVDPRAGLDYSGLEQEVAPRHIGTAVASVRPMHGARVGVELVYLGPYWLDAANTTRYGGHALVNLRGEYAVRPGVQLFARIMNVGDRIYAESGSYTLQRGRELSPGRPRTLFAGIDVTWRRQ